MSVIMTTADPDLPSLAANLRRLRARAGLTQEAMAQAVELSRSGYRNIELGKSEPREETVLALAASLKVSVRDLLTPPPVLHRVRFRSLKRLKRREDVLHEVGRWLRDYCDLEGMLDASEPSRLEALEASLAPLRGDLPALAATVRRAFDLNDDEPVRDICGLLEARGVKVHSIRWETTAFFGLSVAEEDGGPAVIVNTWERIPVETWIFSAAHELAHLLLHLGSYSSSEMVEEPSQEAEANEFASHFLMPQVAFLKEWDETRGLAPFDRILKVKRMFRVSWRTVVYRLGQLYPEEAADIWRYFNGEYKRQTGRSLTKHDEPLPITDIMYQQSRGAEPAKLDAHDFVDDRLSRLVRRAVEEDVVSMGRAAEILDVDRSTMRELANMWFG